MYENNYFYSNQILGIKTENLYIRIIDKGACNLFAVCCIISPTAYCDKNNFKVVESIHFDGLLPSEYIRFSFLFKNYYDEISFNYGEENDDFIIYYEEARLAIDEVLKWKEFWLQ